MALKVTPITETEFLHIYLWNFYKEAVIQKIHPAEANAERLNEAKLR